MKVKSVTYAGKADVYNMEVDETHDFVIQGGMIAHNCADEVRYMCMLNPINPPKAPLPKPKEYDPLDREPIGGQNKYSFFRV